jgi:hypothetical protein
LNAALTGFERAVLDAFLAGVHPVLVQLRAQAAACSVAGRRHSGVGCFIELHVPGSAGRVSPPAITMGDVDVQVAGLPRGATAMLFVRHGALVLLEFVSNEGDWPADPVLAGLRYIRYQPTSTGGYTLTPVTARDTATLAMQLAGHKSSR